MPRNVEIKARVLNPVSLRRTVAELSGGPTAQLVQEDTFFVCPRGRLKLRLAADGAGELIAYQRHDQPGPRVSRFCKAPIGDPDALRAVLGEALGTAGVVRKRRALHLVGQTRIHLDEVEGLGHFVELEVMLRDDQSAADGEAIARDLMAKLQITDEDLIDAAYVDLLGRISEGER